MLARSGRTVPFLAPVAFLAAAFIALGGLLGLGPEPDPVPRRWQLTLEPGPLRVMPVDVPGVGTRSFFYFTYRVTNTTGQDVLFAPTFELANNHGQLQRSGRDVPAAVTSFILRSLENPLIQDQIAVVGLLLQGEENAREGLAIWPVESAQFSDLTLFAAGFSGETRTIEVANPQTGDVRSVTLRKQLMIRYQTPGEIRSQGATPFAELERRWILR